MSIVSGGSPRAMWHEAGQATDIELLQLNYHYYLEIQVERVYALEPIE